MPDEDVLEQARAAGLTIATGVSRLGDTFLRAAQQRAEADVRDKQLHVEDAQRRYEAQAQVAEQLYRRAADPDWMRSVDQAEALGVWEAAQLWADLDQERFRTAADQVTTAYRQAYGTDPVTAVEELQGHPWLQATSSTTVRKRDRNGPAPSSTPAGRQTHDTPASSLTSSTPTTLQALRRHLSSRHC